MKTSLQLRLGQQLTMTPQLQQAIRLLQLSTLDLELEVQEILESNPMLEREDEFNQGQNAPAESEKEQSGENATPAVEEAILDLQNPDTIPDKLSVDATWEEVYQTTTSTRNNNSYDNADSSAYESMNSHTPDLQEHLQWQVELTPFTETDQAIAVAIVDAIDDNGFLTASLEEIVGSIGLDEDVIEEDEVVAVLHRIQQFDPIGVGSRNLQECLILQLKKLPADTIGRELALALVTHHMAELAARDFKTLCRKFHLDENGLREILQLIQSLNPRPGNKINDNKTQYIIPDVTVRKINNRWRVDLNQETQPKLRVNPSYAKLVQRANNSKDNTFMRDNLQEARWFIKSLQSRSETLLKVAKCIVEHQQGFLEHGEEAMKPLVLHDIAEVLEMHESTISRVTTQKFMHTPRGVFELKYFFSSHVSTASGGECSSTAIRALIKKLVAAENPGKPLSDSKIADLLKDQGINVARRTIAKYREAIKIPPSNERRNLV